MRRRQRRTVFLAAILAAVSLPSPAGAQEELPRFRIINLDLPDFDPPIPPGEAHSRAFAITNDPLIPAPPLGLVVGAWFEIDDLAEIPHAFLWLPEPRLGLPAEVMLDLDVLAGVPGPSVAYDLNVRTEIVGHTGIAESDADAVIWQISGTGVVTRTPIPPAAYWTASRAFAITDRLPPVIVGEAKTTLECDGVPPPGRFLERGWRYELVDPSPIELPPLTLSGIEDTDSSGLDINNVETAVGFSTLCGIVPPAPGEDDCENQKEAARWIAEPPAGAAIASFPDADPPDPNGDTGAEAHGINAVGNIVGKAREPDFSCLEHAVFRESPASAAPDQDLHELGDEMAPDNPLPDFVESIAKAVNGNNDRQVVGFNSTDLIAVLWEEVGGVWQDAINLNSVVNIDSCGWNNLAEAHDINDDEWIVGYGTRFEGGNLVKRALVLIPLGECPGDINYDGITDIQDLIAILVGYGVCPPATLCPDVNGDCVVDGTDIALWQADAGCGATAAASAGPSTATIDAILAIYESNPTPETAATCAALLQELCGGGEPSE